MAQRAALQTTGHAGRIVHWLMPSRRQLVVGVAVEVAGLVLGLPLPLHLGLALIVHVVAEVLHE